MHTGKPNVLLVEDSPADANLVAVALEDAHLECNLLVMQDGAKAIDFIDRLDSGSGKDSPDIVLLDLNLPKASGTAVLERIRSSSRCGGAKVLIISSSDAPADRERAIGLGASDYFRKPSSLEQFLRLGPKVQEMLCDGKCRSIA
jgi:DNA-binding response OmpR family regulator